MLHASIYLTPYIITIEGFTCLWQVLDIELNVFLSFFSQKGFDNLSLPNEIRCQVWCTQHNISQIAECLPERFHTDRSYEVKFKTVPTEANALLV